MKTDLLNRLKQAQDNESQSLAGLCLPGLPKAERGCPVPEAPQEQATTEAVRHAQSRTIFFMDNPSFHEVDAESKIVDLPYPKKDEAFSQRYENQPEGKHSGMREPLSPAQEVYLFRKMNFLKFDAQRLVDGLSDDAPDAAALGKIQECLHGAQDIRNQIIASNLPLVWHVVKGFKHPSVSHHEMFSEGSVALLQAIEKFDYSRGFKFSTYLTWAVKNKVYSHFLRTDAEKRRVEALPLTQSTASASSQSGVQEHNYDGVKATVADMVKILPDRERVIILRRFGLDGGEPHTLEQLGNFLGVTKERARQLETRALEMLRKAGSNPLDNAV